MCKRHSFCLTTAGKVLDGCGLTESHTAIMDMHQLAAPEHDTCNLYEWQPPVGWPDANYATGLTVDKATFETRQRHEDAIARHLTRLYPTADSWTTPDAIRWSELPLPNSERVQMAYELALRARPLGTVDDGTVLTLVNLHLLRLGCGTSAIVVADVGRVWASVRESVEESVWESVGESVRDSVWASVGESVHCSMVREDDDNPWLPLAELATHGVYLYSVSDDGVAYVWRGGAE